MNAKKLFQFVEVQLLCPAEKKLPYLNELKLKVGFMLMLQCPADWKTGVAHNVRGLPQGWYFITVHPATEAD